MIGRFVRSNNVSYQTYNFFILFKIRYLKSIFCYMKPYIFQWNIKMLLRTLKFHTMKFQCCIVRLRPKTSAYCHRQMSKVRSSHARVDCRTFAKCSGTETDEDITNVRLGDITPLGRFCVSLLLKRFSHRHIHAPTLTKLRCAHTNARTIANLIDPIKHVDNT